MRRHRKLLVLIALVAMLGLVGESVSFADNQTAEDEFFAQINGVRASQGLPALDFDAAGYNLAHAWSDRMRSERTLYHNQNLGSDYQGESWAALGENVGTGGTVGDIQNAWMNSPSHRANILGDYNRVGVGVMMDGEQMWVTAVFWKGHAAQASAGPGASQAGGVGPAVKCRRVRKRVVCKKAVVKKKAKRKPVRRRR